MDSYRVERRSVQKVLLPGEEGEIGPAPVGGGGHAPEPELDRLSNVLRWFDDLFGKIPWEDAAFRNALHKSDEQTACVEHAKILQEVMTSWMKDDTKLFKQFTDNQDFKQWMANTVCEPSGGQPRAQ